jgi:DNA-binding IscR family transcriptional regulator
VLLCVAREPDIRLRDIAQRVGITERAVQRIVADLVRSGIVSAERVGRRNRYLVDRTALLAQFPGQRTVGQLIDLLDSSGDDPPALNA